MHSPSFDLMLVIALFFVITYSILRFNFEEITTFHLTEKRFQTEAECFLCFVCLYAFSVLVFPCNYLQCVKHSNISLRVKFALFYQIDTLKIQLIYIAASADSKIMVRYLKFCPELKFDFNQLDKIIDQILNTDKT